MKQRGNRGKTDRPQDVTYPHGPALLVRTAPVGVGLANTPGATTKPATQVYDSANGVWLDLTDEIKASYTLNEAGTVWVRNEG